MIDEFHSGRIIMKAPRVFLMVVAIALAAAIGPALTDAADITAASLSKAVDALEAATGGKVLEIRFVDEKGHERFESVVAKPDQVIYMAVDPVAENVTEIAIKELPAWMLNWKLTEYVSSIEKATVPLAKAITKAEAMVGAPAIGAGLAKPLSGANQVLAYNVELLKGGKRRLIAIDATSGAKIANPEALYESWTPVRLVRK
jgi:uncharacterized membrane protein YkoI